MMDKIKAKRLNSTADTYKKKGDREWAYAKNGKGDEHYQSARDAYDRAKFFRNEAKKYQ